MGVLRLSLTSRLLVFCVALAAAACGGGGGGGTTAPGSGTTSPAISPANTMIFVGQSVQFSATGGGTMHWGGDNPGVATVDQTTGRVTGVGIGRVTIWAENNAGRTTRLLRGLPSFAGNWEGMYAINGCQASGIFTEIPFCATFAPGSVLSVQLQLSQADDQVTGSITFGSAAPGTVNASTVGEDGVLPLAAEIVQDVIRVRIDNARIESPTPGTITGTFDQVWTGQDVAGSGILSSEVRSMTRVSGGPALAATAPSAGPVSLEEMMRRVQRRR